MTGRTFLRMQLVAMGAIAGGALSAVSLAQPATNAAGDTQVDAQPNQQQDTVAQTLAHAAALTGQLLGHTTKLDKHLAAKPVAASQLHLWKAKAKVLLVEADARITKAKQTHHRIIEVAHTASPTDEQKLRAADKNMIKAAKLTRASGNKLAEAAGLPRI